MVSQVDSGADSRDLLDWVTEISAALGDIVTALGLVLGLLAALYAYQIYRRRYPRCAVEHLIATRLLPSGALQIRVSVRIRNDGLVLLRLNEGWLRILDMSAYGVPSNFPELDTDEVEFCWNRLKRVDFKFSDHPAGGRVGSRHDQHYFCGPREVEPGESDELDFDFVVPAPPRGPIEAISVYSYFSNTLGRSGWLNRSADGKEFGWSTTTLYSLGGLTNEWTGPLVRYVRKQAQEVARYESNHWTAADTSAGAAETTDSGTAAPSASEGGSRS